MGWPRGAGTIETLIADDRLSEVPPNERLARDYLRQATQHIESAKLLVTQDPQGSFQLLYDGARKAFAAILIRQGLRATSAGGHVALQTAVGAQFEASFGPLIRSFGSMRRLRNTTEYPTAEDPSAGEDDVTIAIPQVEEIIRVSSAAVDNLVGFREST